jgi:hypothetical protein
MNYKKRLLVAVLIIQCLFLISCRQQTHSAAEPKYTFALHLKPGLKYYYTITNETATKLEANNKKVETANNSTVGFIYETVQDTTGGFMVKITYDSLHIVTKKGDAVTEVDAANAKNSIDPLEKMLGSLKGSSLFVTMNNKGEVTSVNGYKEITVKLMSFIDVNNEAEKNTVTSQISGMLGEGFVKNNLQGLDIFPDSALYVGDSWTKQQTQSGDLKLNLNTTYTLQSVKDSIAEIKSSSEVNNNNTATNMMGTNVVVNFKGNEKGSFKTDLRTGMLLNQQSAISVNGTVELNGTHVPVDIKMTKEVVARKLYK